ncbi:DUF6993 domain-containing protein [Pseudarthrobacter sp. O4]|uniref:DUF6993 domain-containing protein n=1 Tax=Pseudarthrobacter sp. O4 TaxID=3418417 RepID=UPI003CF3B21B
MPILPDGRLGRIPGYRLAASLGIFALCLLSAAGCSAGKGAGTSSATPPAAGAASAPEVPAPVGGAPASAPNPSAGSMAGSMSPATPAAKTRLEAALRQVAGGGKPGTEQLRDAVTAAGFPAGDIQVTASRTPTGLDADAVEIAVREGDDCIVGQVRNGTVNVTVLPVLADGRCLVGAGVPGM